MGDQLDAVKDQRRYCLLNLFLDLIVLLQWQSLVYLENVHKDIVLYD
jgi:hypothetical protein